MELFALARNPVPSGAVVGTFAGYDGKPLRFARFAATRGPRRGTVCLFTGFTEFIEKYFEMIADLRRRGFAVAAMDWRGQGGSWRAVTDRSSAATSGASPSTRTISPPSCARSCCPIVRRPTSRSATRWAATSCCAVPPGPAAGSSAWC